MVLGYFFIEYQKQNCIPTIKLKYTTCQGSALYKYPLITCRVLECKCTVCAVPTTKYCNVQRHVVLLVGSFTHKKCLLLVDCVNCIYANAWDKWNEF